MKHEITTENGSDGVRCSCGYSLGGFDPAQPGYAEYFADLHLRQKGLAFKVKSAMTGRSRTVRISQHD